MRDAGKGCEDEAGECAMRAKMKREKRALRAELHDKQNNLRDALLNQTVERCITGYCCSVCKPDYILAMAMGLHARLGEDSPVAALTGDLVHIIVEMTKSKRKLPAWLSCSWNVIMQKKIRARAVLECSRAAARMREYEGDYADSTSQPDSTGETDSMSQPDSTGEAV